MKINMYYNKKLLIKCAYSLLNDIINCKLNDDKFLFMINTHLSITIIDKTIKEYVKLLFINGILKEII
jgi:hypothetical protein